METSSKESKMVSAVVYLHNDSEVVIPFLRVIGRLFSETFDFTEIILVNDCCTDDTISKIIEFNQSAQYQLTLVNMSIYQGLEISMNAGIDLSMGDFVYEFDDLTLDYNEDIIISSYKHMARGFDIISVAPSSDNTAVSGVFYWVFNRFSRSKYKLQSERFRILSRRAINRAYSISKTAPYRKALYANSGLSIDVIRYKMNPAIPKKPRQNPKLRNQIAVNALILYTNLAFKIAITITITMLCLTAFAGVYAAVIYFIGEKPIAGWTTTMLLLSGSFSGLFFVLTIIIKYLSLVVEIIDTKQTYLVESTQKL
ncbi:glycosyltransferase [Flavobacterium sp.]|uniref:glycosyltransferase n=1 Tax=Flavobacterium sp. TaxID=239 RepID=UPI00261F8812|nr:glycosyltransferase [Flavobacterium sp.]